MHRLAMACLAVTACDFRPPAVPRAPVASQVAKIAVPDGAAIAGEWRVAGVAGRPVDQREAITASIRPDRLHLTAGCVNLEWAMTLASGRVAFARRPVEGCARGFTATEEQVVQAIDAGTWVYRLPSNALVFDGTRGALVLFTQ